MLVLAGGGEELHKNTGATAIGPWGTAVQTDLHEDVIYTGVASFIFKALAAGGSKQSSQTAQGWWSYAAYLPVYGNGTHRTMWSLGHDGVDSARLGWAKGASNDEHQVRLVTRTGTYDSAAEFTKEQWHRVKVEFDEGEWTIWASDNGAAFAQVLYQDDSGTYTELDPMHMNVNASTDEGKEANQSYLGDDCLFWDPVGDNWNSRIGAQDFPRISEAHMPDTAGAKTESDAGQAAKLDEIPPDDVDNATIDEDEYWTDIEDFKPIDSGTANVAVSTTAGSPGTLTDTREAWAINSLAGHVVTCNGETMLVASNTATVLTGGDWSGDPGDGFAWSMNVTIQALMVTRVDEYLEAPPDELNKFNVREGGVLSADSEEEVIQWGASVTDSWVTYAGYYPWTPGEVNWTQAVFEACQYGCSLVTGWTDQLTVQAIYFGSAHEWVGPAVTHIRQGVALGSANPMMF